MNRNVKVRNLWLMLLLGVVAVCFSPRVGDCAALTSTMIEDCELNEYGIDCEKKAVLTFPLAFGEGFVIEALSVKQISKNGEP